MKCSCCGLVKPVQNKNSKLMPGTRFSVCEDCIGMEPRYLVLIYGRQNGLNSISEYIRKRKYRGAEIMANELV